MYSVIVPLDTVEAGIDEDLLTDLMNADNIQRQHALLAIDVSDLSHDLLRNPVAWIFVEPLSLSHDDLHHGEKTFNVQERLCSFLSLKDLKNLRKVNKFSNLFVRKSKGFCTKSICRISDAWHKDSQGRAMSNAPWRSFVLEHFDFHRHSDLFKRYWKESSKELLELTMSKSSFECDGFAFIVNECVKLGSLIVEDVKLKHWSQHRSPLYIPPPVAVVAGNQLVGTDERVVQQTLSMRMALKSLKLDKVTYISDCMLLFLSQRSGYLESLELEDCCNEIPVLSIWEQTSKQELCTRFENGIVNLIRVNQASLRKLQLENVTKECGILERLVLEFPEGIQITELSLQVWVEETSNIVLNTFMSTVPRVLEKLNLELIGTFTSDDLDRILSPLAANLTTLQLTINGNCLPANEELELEPVLQRLTHLEAFKIKDNKSIASCDLQAARRKKENRKANLPSAERIMQANESVKTPIASNFITSFPPGINKFSLKHIVLADDFLTDFRNFHRAAGSQTFTKLEIVGPLIKPLGRGFELITREMTQLRTLVLVDCQLTDTTITGIGPTAVRELRRCGSFMLSMLEDNLWSSGSDLTEALNETLMYDPIAELVKEERRHRRDRGLRVEGRPVGNPNYDEENMERAGEFQGPEMELDNEDFFDDEENFGDAGVLAQLDGLVGGPAIEHMWRERNEVRVPFYEQVEHNPNVPIQLRVPLEVNLQLQNEDAEVIIQEPIANQDQEFDEANQEELQAGNMEEHLMDVEMLDVQVPRNGVQRAREINTPRPHIYHLTQLQHLDLSQNVEVTDVTVFDSIKNPELTFLKLDQCNRITDFALEHISKHHPNLEELSVKKCQRLTKYGLNEVISRCKKVKRIHTVKIVAETEVPQFISNISASYKDIVRFPSDTNEIILSPRRRQNANVR